MKFIAYTLLAVVLAFCALLVIGMAAGPTTVPDTRGKQDACSRMWHDAMTTQEKYTARQMCDALGVRP